MLPQLILISGTATNTMEELDNHDQMKVAQSNQFPSFIELAKPRAVESPSTPMPLTNKVWPWLHEAFSLHSQPSVSPANGKVHSTHSGLEIGSEILGFYSQRQR